MSHKGPTIVTFGCRLNTYESEVIRTCAASQDENTIIFNTCGVTAEAERQARQAIRRARRENPTARIIVTGCAVQMNPATYDQMSEVNLVLGNEEKLKPESYLAEPATERVQVNDIMSVKETALHLISGFEERVRAFIQVQNGCDHRCTFCRIPFGRGNSRSVPVGEIVQVCKQLVEQGYQEIVLTGVDITDYGKDLPGKPTLGEMVQRLLKLVPALSRLRLSSLDPVEMDEALFEVIAKEPRLMPHLHLSVQAGDNLILKRMKRRHLREDVLQVCERIRTSRPESIFGADIIVGFPTETEEMFDNTCDLMEKADFTFLHVFPFSPHQGTPAARMPQVKRDVIKERSARLRSLGQHALETYLHKQVGKRVQVLVEKENKGHTETYAAAVLKGDPVGAGVIIDAEVTGVRAGQLECEKR